jgi:hypothetical protein
MHYHDSLWVINLRCDKRREQWSVAAAAARVFAACVPHSHSMTCALPAATLPHHLGSVAGSRVGAVGYHLPLEGTCFLLQLPGGVHVHGHGPCSGHAAACLVPSHAYPAAQGCPSFHILGKSGCRCAGHVCNRAVVEGGISIISCLRLLLHFGQAQLGALVSTPCKVMAGVDADCCSPLNQQAAVQSLHAHVLDCGACPMLHAEVPGRLPGWRVFPIRSP